MPFPSFMGEALYDPETGYYAAEASRTGRAGDFFTSVSVGPVFGELMAEQFCHVWEMAGKPPEFALIESGANDGRFARDVLDWARTRREDFYRVLQYQIDEILPSAVVRQRATLMDHGDKIIHDAALPAACGCYFANEVLDAVPFRRARFSQGKWHELLVGLTESGDFCWVENAPEDRALKRRLDWLGTAFPEGYTTEISPAAASHVRYAASRLERGVLFFADYGYDAGTYYAAHRATGTLRCYHRHQAHENPFSQVGETDITAHVDFSLAATAAAGAGCTVTGFMDQGRFLMGAAEEGLRKMEGDVTPRAAQWHRQFRTLTHPAHLGRDFQFLVLSKSMPEAAALPCLKFHRPSNAEQLLLPVFTPNP